METLTNEAETKPETKVRLPWRKPEIQRLGISLDTADNPGSGADGPTFGRIAPP
jgi:hypothetical protein